MAAQQKLLRDQLSSEQDKVAAAAKAELHMAADNARMATLMDKMESQLDFLEHASRAAEKRALAAEVKATAVEMEAANKTKELQQEIGLLKVARATPAPESPVHERRAAAAPGPLQDIAAAAATIHPAGAS